MHRRRSAGPRPRPRHARSAGGAPGIEACIQPRAVPRGARPELRDRDPSRGPHRRNGDSRPRRASQERERRDRLGSSSGSRRRSRKGRLPRASTPLPRQSSRWPSASSRPRANCSSCGTRFWLRSRRRSRTPRTKTSSRSWRRPKPASTSPSAPSSSGSYLGTNQRIPGTFDGMFATLEKLDRDKVGDAFMEILSSTDRVAALSATSRAKESRSSAASGIWTPCARSWPTPTPRTIPSGRRSYSRSRAWETAPWWTRSFAENEKKMAEAEEARHDAVETAKWADYLHSSAVLAQNIHDNDGGDQVLRGLLRGHRTRRG